MNYSCTIPSNEDNGQRFLSCTYHDAPKIECKNIDAQDNATCLLSKRVFHFLFHKFSQGKIYAKASNATHEGYQYCAL